LEDPPFFREGLYTHSSRQRGVMREVSPRAHRGAWVIGTEALRIVLILREPSDGQERNQNNKDDPNINAHQSSNYQKQAAAGTSRAPTCFPTGALRTKK